MTQILEKQIVNTRFDENLIELTDLYKPSHWKQYPPGTQIIRSYFEARVGARYPFTKFFGLQYILKRYFEGVQITREKIDEAQFNIDTAVGPGTFNIVGWNRLLEKHKGMIPIRICAVSEGLEIPIDNVLFTVENTDPEFPWITNYVETVLTHVWASAGVCTRSKVMKNSILGALEKSGDPGLIMFKLHDFGFRGVSSVETAAVCGAAHLINFLGTDTHVANKLLKMYYNAQGSPGFSIPAYEHSTVTSWGMAGEVACYRNALIQYPKGFVAVVSDSYDVVNACRNIWGTILRDEVLKRDGVLVIRPDSGDPHLVLPVLLDILWEKFGGKINEKGYRVLDPHVRLIQGDGIDENSLVTILDAVMQSGYSIDNLAFGSGGGLLQKIDRDTQRNAFKCNEVTIDGIDFEVFKIPKTDMTKASKGGKLKLIKENGVYRTVKYNAPGENILIPVFNNGNLLVDQKVEEIRNRN